MPFMVRGQLKVQGRSLVPRLVMNVMIGRLTSVLASQQLLPWPWAPPSSHLHSLPLHFVLSFAYSARLYIFLSLTKFIRSLRSC